MENIELKRFWEQVKEELISTLPENAHPWIYPLEVSGFDKGVLTVVTGQMMGRDLLRRNHYEQMNSALQKVSGEQNARFVIIYDENAAKTLKKETEKIQKKISEKNLKEVAMENLSNMQSSSNLNLKYKFENFVIGDNSKFAYAAAKAVAEHPATKYNPLFIYGNSGLGKTHLMQAIGHYTIFNNPKLRVKYTKTDDYVNDYIAHSRKMNGNVESMTKFNRKYTNIDIILIDDIQFIESKMKSMENLQYTFDSLYNKGKQIVITSDRVPKEIPKLTAALCSRFEMGLMIELTPPDLETRLEIIRKIARDNDVQCDEKALLYVARHFSNNVRELEGAFTKVCAYSEISGEPLTLDLAKEVLRCKDDDENIDFEKIAEVTANYYGVELKDIKGSARGQNVAIARHMSIFLCREITNQSFENIAEYYNKKHTTIMYAYEKIRKEKANPEIATAIREIKQALKVV